MSDYSYFFSSFWTGPTGRALREHPGDVSRVAIYLFTCRSSERLGLYYVPKVLICHELGIPLEVVDHALRVLQEDLDYCTYDEELESVWVHEMASWQYGDNLKEKDNNRIRIQKQLNQFPESDLRRRWCERYLTPFGLTRPKSDKCGGKEAAMGSEGGVDGSGTPFEGGSDTPSQPPVEGVSRAKSKRRGREENESAKTRNVVGPPHDPKHVGQSEYETEQADRPDPPSFGAGGRAAAEEGTPGRKSGSKTGNGATLADELHSLVGGLAHRTPAPAGRGYNREKLEQLCEKLGLEYIPPRKLSSNARKMLQACELYAPWAPATCLRAMERVIETRKPEKLNNWLFALGEQLLNDAKSAPGDQRDDGSDPCPSEPTPESPPNPPTPTTTSNASEHPEPEQLN